MIRDTDIQKAIAAKDHLTELLSEMAWWGGIGIVPTSDGSLGIRITIDAEAAGEGMPELPTEFEGVPVQTVVMKPYRPR